MLGGLLALLLLAGLARADTRTLAWDPNPPEENVTEYRVWEWVDVAPVLVGATGATELTFEVGAGTHTWTVTALNAYGLSSDHSVSVSDTVGGWGPGATQNAARQVLPVGRRSEAAGVGRRAPVFDVEPRGGRFGVGQRGESFPVESAKTWQNCGP